MTVATAGIPASVGRFPASSDAFTPWHDARHWIGGAWRDPAFHARRTVT